MLGVHCFERCNTSCTTCGVSRLVIETAYISCPTGSDVSLAVLLDSQATSRTIRQPLRSVAVRMSITQVSERICILMFACLSDGMQTRLPWIRSGCDKCPRSCVSAHANVFGVATVSWRRPSPPPQRVEGNQHRAGSQLASPARPHRDQHDLPPVGCWSPIRFETVMVLCPLSPSCYPDCNVHLPPFLLSVLQMAILTGLPVSRVSRSAWVGSCSGLFQSGGKLSDGKVTLTGKKRIVRYSELSGRMHLRNDGPVRICAL